MTLGRGIARSASQRVARNVVLRTSGEVVAKVASLVFFVSVARQLGAAAFGAFMFALGLTGVLALAAGFGTDGLVAREVADDRQVAGRMLTDVAALKAIAASALLVAAVGVVALGPFPGRTVATVAVVGLGVTVEVLAKTWDAVLLGHERLDLVALTTIVQRTTTVSAWLVVLLIGPSLMAASLCFLGGALAGLATDEWAVRRLAVRRPRPDPSHWWALARTGVPFGLASLLFLLLLRVDVVLLSFLAGERQVGYYAAGYRLVESTQFVAWAIGAALLPWLVRSSVGGAVSLARGYELGLKVSNLVLVPVSVGLVLFADALVRGLYGADFEPAVKPLQLLGATAALYGVLSLAGTTFVARNEPAIFARLVGVVAVANVVANLLVVPSYGADGAAAVALASSAVLAVAASVVLHRRFGPIRLWRCTLSPVVGAAVMVAVRRLRWPDLAEVGLGLVAYGVTVATIELVAFGDDLLAFRRALPDRFDRGRPIDR